MPFAARTRRISLLVLAAYLAAQTLGAVLHERLHVHAGDSACCHTHAAQDHSQRCERPADPAGDLNGLPSHDDGCVVCRIAGQKVLPAVAATADVSAGVYPDLIPSPAAAPRTIAARLAQSRAPPRAV
jgi:hypothetical protein